MSPIPPFGSPPPSWKKSGSIDIINKNTGNVLVARTNNKALDASVAAENVYVDLTSGNDTTGDGTSSLPYLTVQKAVNVLPRIISKDTEVRVSNGTATEQIDFSGMRVFNADFTIRAMDTSDRQLYDDGTATAGGATTITDTAKSWTTNLFTNGVVYIYEGTGRGQVRTISSNTATQLTVSVAWATNPDTTSLYAISGVVVWDGTSLGTGVPFAIANMVSTNIRGFKFTGYNASSLTTACISAIDIGDVLASHCYFSGPNRGMLANNLSVANVQKCYFAVPASDRGMLAQQYSIIIPRGNAFVAATGGSGAGIIATRNSFVVPLNSTGSRNYFQDLAVGLTLDTQASGESLAAASLFTNNTLDYEPTSFGHPTEFVSGLVASNSAIGSNKYVTDILPPAGTGGLFTLARNDGTVASGDLIGRIQWWNNDSTLTTQNIYGNIEVQASQDITTDAAAGLMLFRTTGTAAGGGPTEAMRIAQSQAVTFASPTGGFGYGTGAGGTVTQATNKSTGVTLNKVTGQITMNGAALAAAAIVSFTLTNSAIVAADILLLNHKSVGTAGAYLLNAQAGAGSALITVRNTTAGSLSEAIVIGFSVIKAVTA